MLFAIPTYCAIANDIGTCKCCFERDQSHGRFNVETEGDVGSPVKIHSVYECVNIY